jgi:glycosyltransferase involved in cell wall biosynthesis
MESAALSGRANAPTLRSGARGVACLPPPLRTNPYQTLLYGSLRERGYVLVPDAALKIGSLTRNTGRVAVLHLHWPESYYRHLTGPSLLRRALSWVKLAVFAARLQAARILGYRIVWTAHQVLPHETSSARLDLAGARVVAQAAHSIIVHDDATAASLETAFGSRAARKAAVVPHGPFADAYGPGRPRPKVRSELGLAEATFVFLAFGHVRAYKDLDLLIEGFCSAELGDAALLIAGQAHDATVVASVTEAARRDPRIVPLLQFIDDDRVAELFNAVDAAVVARRDGGTSGVLVLAQAFETPIVAADTPTYREALGDGAGGWLFAPGDVNALAHALAAAAASNDARERGSRAAARPGWDEIGVRTAALYGGAGG